MTCYNLDIYQNIFNDLSNNFDNLKKENIIFKNHNDYILLKYKKEKLDENNINTLGLIRSCIFKNNKLISYSPPKSTNYNNFKINNNISECSIEEFIDGTMINLYYDNNIQGDHRSKWQISTKSFIGAQNNYFKKYVNDKSFRTMFIETCLDNDFDYGILPKEYSYCFIMQHKENRIVTPIYDNNLYLVKCYNINGLNVNIVDLNIIKKDLENTRIKFPNIYNFESYDLLEKELINLEYKQKGYYIVNYNNYVHTKILNPKYEYVLFLKGNNSKLQYTYLTLKKNNNISKYLEYFPENYQTFLNYEEDCQLFITNLYNYYVSKFIKKEIELDKINKEYIKHLYKIHCIYINNKKLNNYFYIKPIDVNDYFNELNEAQQMYNINYKNYKDNNILK